MVNYHALPRLGLPAPHLLRTKLPASVSERASHVDTVVPDSTGDFPLRVVRSVPLLPNRHSTTAGSARLFSRLNTAGSVVSIVLPSITRRTVNLSIELCDQLLTTLDSVPDNQW